MKCRTMSRAEAVLLDLENGIRSWKIRENNGREKSELEKSYKRKKDRVRR